MTTERILFCLLRNEICGTDLPADFDLTDKIGQVYRLSVRHDIAHLTGDALFRNNLLPENKIGDAFKEQMRMAVIRVEQQTAELQSIEQAFDDAKIPYIPLKGAVVREMYPKSWMRTSCDIDILVREKDLERASDTLSGNGFKTDGKFNYHDISFYSENIHVELHFNICENIKQLDGLLSEVWDYAELLNGNEYREMPEYYVYHHLAHMAYHFLSGGCGIRPFLDLWILKAKGFYNEVKLLPLLEKSNLVKFYLAVNKLIYVWLKDDKYDDITLRMAKYVIVGGVYGSAANSYSVGAATSKGKKRYLLKLAFPRYKIMCIIYPSLKKYKILLPFYYLHRIFIKTIGKDRKKVKSRIVGAMSQSKERIAKINSLLSELELKR